MSKNDDPLDNYLTKRKQEKRKVLTSAELKAQMNQIKVNVREAIKKARGGHN